MWSRWVGGWVRGRITSQPPARQRKTNEKQTKKTNNKQKTNEKQKHWKRTQKQTKLVGGGKRAIIQKCSKMHQTYSKIQQQKETYCKQIAKYSELLNKYNKHSRCNCFPGCSGRSVGGDWTTPNGRPIGGGISVKSADFPENQWKTIAILGCIWKSLNFFENPSSFLTRLCTSSKASYSSVELRRTFLASFI